MQLQKNKDDQMMATFEYSKRANRYRTENLIIPNVSSLYFCSIKIFYSVDFVVNSKLEYDKSIISM